MTDPGAFLDTIAARLAVHECVAENAIVFLLASKDAPSAIILMLEGLRSAAEERAKHLPEAQRDEALRAVDQLFKGAEAKWWATRLAKS